MEKLPTKEENPNGLHQKYIVSKADGTPIDKDAIYFVLRVDDGAKDQGHLEACREALFTYASHMLRHNIVLANDLLDLLSEFGEFEK